MLKREYSDFDEEHPMPEEDRALYDAAGRFAEALYEYTERRPSAAAMVDIDDAARALRHAAHKFHTAGEARKKRGGRA